MLQQASVNPGQNLVCVTTSLKTVANSKERCLCACRAPFIHLALQEKLPILEKALEVGILAIKGPATSEAASLLLTMFSLLRDMVSWAVNG